MQGLMYKSKKKVRRQLQWQKRQRKYDTEYKIQVVKLAKELDSTKAVAELGILEN